MAKWGEGDPRWIVEERPDATNVNNWHWTEKNACQWSQDKLKQLLIGLEIEDKVARCIITDIDKCEGEAVVNNRKGKLIFFYEWNIIASWQARVNGGTESIDGKVSIPNLSEENDVSEVEVDFALNDSTNTEGEIIMNFLRHNGKSKVREQLNTYIKELKEEFSRGLILPKKGEDSNSKPVAAPTKYAQKLNENNTTGTAQTSNSGKLATKTLKTSQTFQCTAEELYNALTITELVTAFTHGPVILDTKKGGKFELFGGHVHGTFDDVVKNEKIIQQWRTKQWPEGHYSTVTITIQQNFDNTILNLVQTGIPENHYDSTKENWNRYYWDPMKRTLGFGSFIV